MSTTAFILSYNHQEKLIECVESLLAQSCIKEILILENFSIRPMEETYLTIQNLSPIIRIEYATTPHSYSEGQNWGLDQAKYPYVLLMNNDAIILQKEVLQTSVDFLEKNSEIGIVGHKIINLDGTLNHFGMYFSFQPFWAHHFGRNDSPKRYLYQRPMTCVAATGACVLVRKTAIRFDTHYWFEHEDVDFCLQYRKAGWGTLCNPYFDVLHDESSSRGEIQNVNVQWIGKQQLGTKHFLKKWSKNRLGLSLASFKCLILSFQKEKATCLQLADIPAGITALMILVYFKLFVPILIAILAYFCIRYLFIIIANNLLKIYIWIHSKI